MSSETPPRYTDIFRHLEDLRTRSYEGRREWSDKVAVFRRAAALLDPVVRRVLEETDRAFLDGTGTVEHRLAEDRDGDVAARWELSWPAQRRAQARDGGRVPPIQVIATFRHGAPHPHLSGSLPALWPCQVLDEKDADRQEQVVRAIVETELHQRIFEGRWPVVPAFARRHPPGG